MDARFLPAFQKQLIDLTTTHPDFPVYKRLQQIVETADKTTLPPILLRPDGTLFLVLNLGQLVVIPWKNTESSDFFLTHGSDIESDIKDILVEAKQLAQQRNASQISANLLLETTATRRQATRTRSLNIWGP